MKIFILFSMIFCHIVDDFYLQGCLAKFKQKKWWQENYPNELYRNDWIISLLIHAFSWTFMIMLPTMAWTLMDISIGYLLAHCSVSPCFSISDSYWH